MRDAQNHKVWRPEDFLWFWIHHAGRLLMRLGDARLRPLGMSIGQIPILHALRDGKVLSQLELVRKAHVTQPGISQLLSRMARDGLIRISVDPDDGRGRRISLTKKASSRMADAHGILLRGNFEAMAGLTEREVSTLYDLLSRVIHNLDPHIIDDGT
jgi:MarR family transcriptional regulator, transcriptional regulator for hemolysin